jgi:hypothetical protein
MPDTAPQSFANHAKFAPIFHFALAPLSIGLLVWTVVRLVKAPSEDSAMWVLAAVVLLLTAAVARSFPLQVQDRVIRLEETVRLHRLLPADMQSQIGNFTMSQLIALRFASDRELPELARRVLRDKITDRKAIKQMVTEWRPDHFRV